jgi:hypothetical protein
MSREVNVYTKGGEGSIGLVPGVVPAAWGGPGRARGAVRAVPKTEDLARTRVKKVGSALTPPAPFSAKDMGRSHHTEIPPIEL